MSHSTSDTHAWTEYGAPFDDDDADVVLRSSDGVHFRVYKVILSKASPFFKELFALPQPAAPPPDNGDKKSDSAETCDGLPLIAFSETKIILSLILTLCYPLSLPLPPTLNDIILVLAAAQKYDLARASEWAADVFTTSPAVRQHPAKAFALACSHRLEREARLASRMALRAPMNLDVLAEQLPFMDGITLQRLLHYHRQCVNVVSDLTKPEHFSWIGRRNGIEVWEWASLTPCNCERSSHLFANSERWNCKKWWTEYMERAGDALRVKPAGETVGIDALLRPSYESAAICNTCRLNVIPCLSAFSRVFAAEVDQRTSQVEVDLPF